MRCLVTGGTGFIGYHLVSALRKDGHEVRILVRETSDTTHLEPLGVELVAGDILDQDSMTKAIGGMDWVFHLAAITVLSGVGMDRMREVNVGGTRNVLEAAVRAGVSRVVHHSSSAALGASTEPQFLDESVEWNFGPLNIPYLTTKREAEELALSYARRGLEIMAINPPIVIGHPDFHVSGGGGMVLGFLKGRVPGYLKGGHSYVDVRDVARGLIQTAERGRPGERYILLAQTMTHEAFYRLLGEIAGMKPPRFTIPYPLAYALAETQEVWARLRGKRPFLFRDLIRMGRLYWWYEGRKAREELGFHPRPIHQTLTETVTWFRENGYC